MKHIYCKLVYLRRKTGLPSRLIQAYAPQLKQKGSTKYDGSVNLNGIVVSASGVQPWFDEMISGIIAWFCQGLVNQLNQLILDDDEYMFLTEEAIQKHLPTVLQIELKLPIIQGA